MLRETSLFYFTKIELDNFASILFDGRSQPLLQKPDRKSRRLAKRRDTDRHSTFSLVGPRTSLSGSREKCSSIIVE